MTLDQYESDLVKLETGKLISSDSSFPQSHLAGVLARTISGIAWSGPHQTRAAALANRARDLSEQLSRIESGRFNLTLKRETIVGTVSVEEYPQLRLEDVRKQLGRTLENGLFFVPSDAETRENLALLGLAESEAEILAQADEALASD